MPVLSTVAAACARAWGFTAGDLFAGAALALDFDRTTTLDSRITFTRATSATYFDSSGVLQTASSGVARFDHRLENSVWVNKGLLIEEQRTNICLQSENLDTTWVNTNTTESLNATDAPDGNTTADAVFETTTNGLHAISQDFVIDMTSTNYTASAFVKANGRTKGILQIVQSAPAGNFRVDFDLVNETVSTVVGGTGVEVGSSITNVGDGWYRVSISGRTGQTGTNIMRLILQEDDGTFSYTGDVTKGMFMWGAQLETGAFGAAGATSYIKTTTASVTRNADVAVMTGTDFSDWYNQTEGTMFIQNSFFDFSASPRAWALSNNIVSERMIYLGLTSALRTFGIDGNVSQWQIDSSAPSKNQVYKSAVAIKANDIAFALGGSLVGTDASATLATPDRLYIGSNYNGSGSEVTGHIAKLYYWNTRKPDSFLQNITS